MMCLWIPPDLHARLLDLLYCCLEYSYGELLDYIAADCSIEPIEEVSRPKVIVVINTEAEL